MSAAVKNIIYNRTQTAHLIYAIAFGAMGIIAGRSLHGRAGELLLLGFLWWACGVNIGRCIELEKVKGNDKWEGNH